MIKEIIATLLAAIFVILVVALFFRIHYKYPEPVDKYMELCGERLDTAYLVQVEDTVYLSCHLL